MTLAVSDGRGCEAAEAFVIEDLSTGVFASGFGHLGDGRRFSFYLHRAQLVVEVYRPRRFAPVPLPEDVIAAVRRPLADLDPDDGRSLSAAVYDMIAALAPGRRRSR